MTRDRRVAQGWLAGAGGATDGVVAKRLDGPYVPGERVTGDRFRHGTALLRWRLDKSPHQCTFEQIAPASRPPPVIRRMLR